MFVCVYVCYHVHGIIYCVCSVMYVCVLSCVYVYVCVCSYFSHTELLTWKERRKKGGRGERTGGRREGGEERKERNQR